MKFEQSRLEPSYVTINDVEYPIKLTFKGMMELEETLDMAFLTFVMKFETQDVTNEQLLQTLVVMLKNAGNDITIEDFNELDFSFEIMTHFTVKIFELLSKTQSVVSTIKEVNKGTGKSTKK